MDLGAVALIAVIAGLAGGAVGAALVGTVEGMLRQRQSHRDRGTRYVRDPTPRGGAPFNDFNDRAKRVLALAQDEATRFNHSYIGTEHLLLGLSREGEGVAARALESLGATLPKLCAAVEPKRGTTTVLEKIDLSESSKAAISNARSEVRKLGHSYVGTEHLLLGLVLEHGAAVALLRELDIDPEQVRHRVIATLGQPQPSVAIDQLDVDSRKIVTLARQEAIQSGHSYIGSENLAMALRIYSPTLDRIWSQLRIDPEVLRRRIEAAVPPTLGVLPTEGSWTQRVARIVRMAHGVAAERQRSEVAPEHLLIALATEGGGAGAEVLALLGATPQRIREIVDRPKS